MVALSHTSAKSFGEPGAVLVHPVCSIPAVCCCSDLAMRVEANPINELNRTENPWQGDSFGKQGHWGVLVMPFWHHSYGLLIQIGSFKADLFMLRTRHACEETTGVLAPHENPTWFNVSIVSAELGREERDLQYTGILKLCGFVGV